MEKFLGIFYLILRVDPKQNIFSISTTYLSVILNPLSANDQLTGLSTSEGPNFPSHENKVDEKDQYERESNFLFNSGRHVKYPLTQVFQ